MSGSGSSNAASYKGRLARLLALFGKPVRRTQRTDGIVVEAFRGYATRERMFVIGRVFRQSPSDVPESSRGIATQLRDVGRRISRRKVVDALIEAGFGTATRRTRMDRDGFFRFDLELQEASPPDRSWHCVGLFVDTDPPVHARADVYVPSDTVRLVVVSDIDDTVMHTGVGNKLAMLWRLFVADAKSRVAFPGVAAFYRAPHDGAGGGEDNPVLYVSRAPWGTYDMLTAFFRMRDIPVGPELFLREWGASWRHLCPQGAGPQARDDRQHAGAPSQSAVHPGRRQRPARPGGLCGRVREHPGRVRAVYIRNVSRKPSRTAEIEDLARAVTDAGSTLLLASDTVAVAEHAATLGLVGSSTASEVAGERAADVGDRRSGTVHADQLQGSAAALATAGEGRFPPDVVVGRGDGRET